MGPRAACCPAARVRPRPRDDAFVDGAPPPIVATLPLLIDGAREAVELAVREGDDVAALLGAVTPRLSADNVDQVTSALYLRAAKGGHTVARRWYDADPALEDLHPTHPAAFKRTAPAPLGPAPALRRLSLDARRPPRAAPAGDDALLPRVAAAARGLDAARRGARSDGAAFAAAVDVGGDAARTWPNGPGVA
ncbi:hypothetical protein JL720_14702 [Aureococcus anophagefferens]|nr:hypothetical protein JL720_14702 [Aureococcus anophagefferens]